MFCTFLHGLEEDFIPGVNAVIWLAGELSQPLVQHQLGQAPTPAADEIWPACGLWCRNTVCKWFKWILDLIWLRYFLVLLFKKITLQLINNRTFFIRMSLYIAGEFPEICGTLSKASKISPDIYSKTLDVCTSALKCSHSDNNIRKPILSSVLFTFSRLGHNSVLILCMRSFWSTMSVCLFQRW